MLIGVTGLTNSGKEQILDLLKSEYEDYIVINTTKLYSLLIKDALYTAELIAKFGKDIVDKNKKVTRETINRIAMKGNGSATKLNELTSRYGIKIIHNIENQQQNEIPIIIDVASLLDFGFADICDKVVISTARKEIRAKRLSEKTNISYESALERLSIQRTLEYDKDNCIYVITEGNAMNNATKKIIIDFIKK